MKNLIIIVLTIVFISCNAQKTNTMKKFDIETFNKKKNSLDEYHFTLDNKVIVEQRKSGNEYIQVTKYKYKDKYIEEYQTYHKNGNLKLEGLFLSNNFNKGIWKEYDKNGKLIEEINYDKGFDYTWEDLLKYLLKRKVDIKGRYTTIRKEEGNWRIWHVEGIYIYDVTINGKTGKVLDDSKNIFDEGS